MTTGYTFSRMSADRIVKAVRKSERTPIGGRKGRDTRSHQRWFPAMIGESQIDWSSPPENGLKAYKYAWMAVRFDNATRQYIPTGQTSNGFARPAINTAERRAAVNAPGGGSYLALGIAPSWFPQVGSFRMEPIGPMSVVLMAPVNKTDFVFCAGPNLIPECGTNTPQDPIPGACCDERGECTDNVLPADCAASGGTHYPGQPCNAPGFTCPTKEPQQWACCIDKVCQMLLEVDCTGAGGVWHDGVNCASGICESPTGACCPPAGNCVIATQNSCNNLNGQYFGDGSTCNGIECEGNTGACCHFPGSCTNETASDCAQQGGNFRGVGTDCNLQADVCENLFNGACCFHDSTCAMHTASSCASAGGVFRGVGVMCEPGLCSGQGSHPGACCKPNGQCEVMSPENCAGIGGDFVGSNTCAGVVCQGPA